MLSQLKQAVRGIKPVLIWTGLWLFTIGVPILVAGGLVQQSENRYVELLVTPIPTATLVPTVTPTQVPPTHIPTYTPTPYVPAPNGLTKLRQENHQDYIEVDFLSVRSMAPIDALKETITAVKFLGKPVRVTLCVVSSDADKLELGNVSLCQITYWVNAESGD